MTALEKARIGEASHCDSPPSSAKQPGWACWVGARQGSFVAYPRTSLEEATSRLREEERGSAVLELPFVLGLIVLPFALLVLQLPIWVQHQAAAEDAAAEVARAVAIHGSDVDVAALVATIESVRGLPVGSLQVEVETGGRPGDSIVARASVDMPTLTFPVFGVMGQTSWATTHTERLADFGSVER